MKHSELLPYESPCTLVTRIETEGSVCGSANIINPDAKPGRINAQEVNDNFMTSFDSADNDANTWETVNE